MVLYIGTQRSLCFAPFYQDIKFVITNHTLTTSIL